MEKDLSLRTRLEVKVSSLVLLYEVAIQPRMIRPLDLAVRIFIFAFPASKLAYQHFGITLSLLLCFSSAAFYPGATRNSFSTGCNRAIASCIYAVSLGCAQQTAATIPLLGLGSWLCSSRIYWIIHYIKWIDTYFSWRRHSLLILFAKRKLRSIEQCMRLFGDNSGALLINVSLVLLMINANEWQACAGKAFTYCLIYSAWWGIFGACPWWMKWILLCLYIVNVYKEYGGAVKADCSSGHRNGEYVHKALSGSNHVRLLLLHPRHPTSPIRFTVIETSLNSAPLYEAISYTWGSGEKKHCVYMDGGKVQVTANLYDLLRVRSSALLPRLLWIDSISIDQLNEAEKAQQIQLMGDIYRRAFLVSVCLGFHAKAWANLETVEMSTRELGQNTKPLIVLRMIEEIKNTIDAHISLDILEELRLTNSELEEATVWKSIAGYRQPFRFAALTGLIQNPWFARIWVVQEVALASSVRVCHGKRSIPWETFTLGLDALGRNPQLGPLLEWTNVPKEGEIIPEPPNSNLLAARMNDFRTQIQSRGHLSFSKVLLSCHKFKATEMRDNVFGILGMCPTNNSDIMISDYLAPIADVYLNSAKCVVRDGSASALLSIAGIGYFPDMTDGLQNLPTWVPDWSRPPRVIALANLDPRLDYKAGGPEASTDFQQSGPSLFSHGYVVDVVENIGPFMEIARTGSAETGTEELRVLMDALNDSYSMISSSSRNGQLYTHISPAQPLDEVFLRTLIVDRSPTSWPAEPTFVGHARGFERRVYKQLGLKFQERFKVIRADEPSSEKMDSMEYLTAARRLRLGLTRGGMRRRFCISKDHYIGLVPPFARSGDIICVILGVQTPLIFRKLMCTQPRAVPKYQLVGEAYVHGLMNGEALKGPYKTELLEIV